MTDVTQILSAIEQGDTQAAERLLPLVYGELRRLAARKMVREAPGHTLQPTDLVHEAYLRLVDVDKAQRWNSRGHFFAAAAEAMRRILVERVRRKRRHRHGGEHPRVGLSEEVQIVADDRWDDVLAVDAALEALAQEDPRAAELVKLRYFGGLKLPEAAAALDVSPRTVDRLWAYAKAWLHQRLRG
ncbi:MAG: sigma-70 family RNA polymerase sigma factor [Planctomycetota bacterium]|jgi:RNA polymerase sigma factor (TIGR02999 family)